MDHEPRNKETASTVEAVASNPNEQPPFSSTSRPEVLTADEVAALLRVNRKTVYAAFKRGEIPGGRKVGRALRFSRDVVLKWIAGGSEPDEVRSALPFPGTTVCPFCLGETVVEHLEDDGVLYACQSESCERYGYSRMLHLLDDGTICDTERAMNLGAVASLEVHNRGDHCEVETVGHGGSERRSAPGNLSLLEALGTTAAVGAN